MHNSTGNYNKIEPTIDEETNTIRFTDEVRLPEADKIFKNQPKDIALFRMYGYWQTPGASEAGIVRDLSLTTTVSPKLATMLTIGAQSNGYITGQDSTALSVMNYGLTDRVKEEWIEPASTITYPSPPPSFIAPNLPQSSQFFNFLNFLTNLSSPTQPTQPAQSTPPSPTSPQTLDQKYKDVIDSFHRFIQEMAANSWNQGDITAFTNSIQSFAEYNQAEVTLKQRQSNGGISSPNIGFLPFDLTLTIDGLSGMKIYQKFIADTEFLPSNYPQSLEFLIKGITHEIKDNQWITKLESLAVPRDPLGSNVIFNVGSPRIGQPNPTQNRPSTFSTNTAPPSSVNLPPSTQATTSQIQAFHKAYDIFWNKYSPVGGVCGRYSAKLAGIYVKVLRNIPLNLPAGRYVENGAGGDNAGTPGHISKIISFGYTKTDIGKNLTKSQMINLFDNPANFGSFSPGDVVTYKSTTGYPYHSMVFTGGYGGSFWTTDVKDNYLSKNAVGFVHKNKNKYPSNSYNAWLLKAPQS